MFLITIHRSSLNHSRFISLNLQMAHFWFPHSKFSFPMAKCFEIFIQYFFLPQYNTLADIKFG
jgi:hypothetical protein